VDVKLGQMIIVAALLVFVIAPIGFLDQRKYASMIFALYLVAFILVLIEFALLYMAILNAYTDAAVSKDYAQTKWMQEFSKLDDEGRQALAARFPEMRYRMARGVVRAYWEDTKVPIEMFKTFLATSTREYISPERDWNSTAKPRWAWLEIKTCLEDAERIIPDSAAGSHSWRWVGNSHQYLCAYWMAGRALIDLNEAEGAVSYAADTEGVELN
jgi:hypothetical protein